LPEPGKIQEVFNSDHKKFYGTGNYLNTPKKTTTEKWHSRKYSTAIDIAPLAMLAFKYSD
jgi:1,4-alpha-glucan branching enzyme